MHVHKYVSSPENSTKKTLLIHVTLMDTYFYPPNNNSQTSYSANKPSLYLNYIAFIKIPIHSQINESKLD